MARAYSEDLRERVLGAIEQGKNPREIAQQFGVSHVWVYQVKKRLQETGERKSLPMGGHRISRIADLEGEIRGWVDKENHLTLREMSEWLEKEKGIILTIFTLCRRLKKWGITFKKKHCGQPSKIAKRYKKHEISGKKIKPH